MDFSQLPERIFCTLWCHDSISKVAKQWLVLCTDIKQKVISTNESHISNNNENASNGSKSINDNVVIKVLSNNDPTQNSTKVKLLNMLVRAVSLEGLPVRWNWRLNPKDVHTMIPLRTMGVVITLLHLLRFPPSSQKEASCGCIFGQI